MRRARILVAALVVWTAGHVGQLAAQTTAPPEGWVVLPLDEYKALREKANPAPSPPTPPPVDATLTRVDYDLRADDETVTGRARLTIDVLRDG